MLTRRDLQFLAEGATLVGCLLALVAQLGVEIPLSAATWVFGAIAVLLVGLRVYVRIVGAANTRVDEGIEQAEDLVDQVRPVVAKPAKPLNRIGPAALLVLLLALVVTGCAGKPKAKAPTDYLCSDVAVIAVDESCAAAYASAKGSDIETVKAACDTLIEGQSRVCKAVEK